MNKNGVVDTPVRNFRCIPVVKNPFPIIDAEMNGSCLLISDSIYLINNGVKTDLGTYINALAEQIRGLAASRDHFYIYSQNGLYSVKKDGSDLNAYYSSNECLSSDFVNSIDICDDLLAAGTREGLTIRTFNNSLNILFEKYRGSRTIAGWFTLDPENCPIKERDILSVKIIGGSIYLVSQNYVTIYDWNRDYFEEFPKDEYLHGAFISEIKGVGDNVFFSTYGGISRYEPMFKKWTLFEEEEFTQNEAFIGMTFLSGYAYFCTSGMILSMDMASEIFRKLFESTDTAGRGYIGIEGYKDNVFVATPNGLTVYDPSSSRTSLLLPGYTVLKILIRSGVLFAVTNNEIFRIE